MIIKTNLMQSNIKLTIVVMLLCLFSIHCVPTDITPHHDEDTFLGLPLDSVHLELDRLIHAWYPRIVDTINGGYWTHFKHDWAPTNNTEKMIVTQARGLWTAARAARFYKDDELFRHAADHGFLYLTQQMWDEELGGFFQYDANTRQKQHGVPFKMTYGNAFALYAIAEYARINPSEEVMGWLEQSFQWMENQAHDPEHLGYFNLIIPADYKNSTDTSIQRQITEIGWGDPHWKDQNSSIHILEALTNVVQVWDHPMAKTRLEEMLHLVRDTMVSDQGSLFLYFKNDWQPIHHKDSSRTYILENQRFDHRSFGHDIETAYLLVDAAYALYGQVDEKTHLVAKRLIDHSIAHGFDENFYGLYDRGYRFNDDGSIAVINKTKWWWVEAEAWHALGLFATLYPEEKVYQEGYLKMWQYLQNEMIDHQNGGWHAMGLDENPEGKTAAKAHAWKGAYHNGRALFQIAEYGRGNTIR